MYDLQAIEEIRRALEKWEETTFHQSLARLPERRASFITTSSQPINRLYTPLDIPDLDYLSELGLPGEDPYTRGIHPTLYRGRPWTMRMFAGFGTAEETNQRFHFLLDQGQTGLSVAFDLPTLMGLDTDAPEAAGEFGMCGVAVASLEDMEILLKDIPLDKVSTSMTINSPAAVIWAMYLAAAEKQGVRPDQLRGTIQNDILKEYIAQKEYIFPPEPPVAFGPIRCAERSTPKIPARGCFASTPRRPESALRLSSQRTTSCASPSRPSPPSWAGPNPCPPTRWMRRWRSPLRMRRRLPCAPSKSLPRRLGLPIPWIPSVAPSSWKP